MKHVFGPVPSRRLGMSLGVDPIPYKTCNWNCVYCQLGRSAPLVTERREFIDRHAILREVEQALGRAAPGAVDHVTFAGSGEPTLHTGLGWMIRAVKRTSAVPVAVITNGSLLHLEEVRDELLAADAVLPTLDAADEATYRRVDRAAPGLDFARHVAGLFAFRAAYRGRLLLEVMLIDGMNDGDESLERMAGLVRELRPDEVHINVPSRPAADARVRAPGEERLERARALFAAARRADREVVRPLELPEGEELLALVLGVVVRHPMEEAVLERDLERHGRERVRQTVDRLLGSGLVKRVRRQGKEFLCCAQGRYAEG